MDSEILISGLSHHETELSLREKFSFSKERWNEALQELNSLPGMRGAVLVSTCNRFEIVYSLPRDREYLLQSIEDLFSKWAGLSSKQFSKKLYHLKNLHAVEHLFRVASGLDSLIIGEPQILGQLKAAYDVAKESGTTSSLLNRLFHRAFGVAKAIRTNTRIGHQAVSVCYAAKELAEQIFGDLGQAKVMLIGAGQMGELALKHFSAAGVKSFFIVNKTLERAYGLAEKVQGVPLQIANFRSFLNQADIIIGTSTLDPTQAHLVSAADAHLSVRSRPGRAQFFIDLGVPRNFSPEVGNVEDVFLYNIDDLKEIVERNLGSRMLEMKRAEIIVSDEVEKFSKWLKTRTLVPTIKALRAQFSSFQESEIKKSLRRFRMLGFSEEQCQVIENLLEDYSAALLSKVLHRPVTYVKEAAVFNPAIEVLFRDLFIPSNEAVCGEEKNSKAEVKAGTFEELSPEMGSKEVLKRLVNR